MEQQDTSSSAGAGHEVKPYSGNLLEDCAAVAGGGAA
jgi:hypothetical protein